MNKVELVDEIATKTGLTKKDTEAFVKAFVESVTQSLAKGEDVQLIGFGSFKVAARAQRVMRNPQTGEQITVPATNVPKFVAGKALKDAVNVKPKSRAKSKKK